MKKSKLMIQVEKEKGQPLEAFLPDMITERGLIASAEELGVNKATLGYWLLKMGIMVKRVALAPGESLRIERLP